MSCKSDDETILSVNPLDCVPTNLQNAVVAYYPFTDGSINDFSGNNQNLTNSTAAASTSDRNANENCAFEFNYLSGTNEFLSTSNTTQLDDLTDFSISLWYQPLEVRTVYELLIGRGLDHNQWNLALFDCRHAVFSWTSDVWDNDPNFDCDESVSNHDWHHLVATYNNSTNTMKLFRNGNVQETSDYMRYPNASHIEDLIVGNQFTGKIDDILIFNITLNQTDVDSLLNMEACCN
ncbi:hypothetical protein GCM10008083_34140 [Ulvibacter litoralis]|nr:hypothetical protein GCM10008083_34140 [Ulvibacter litoralis]